MIKKIVLGMGFGDEGKGRVVDWLCSQSKDSVVVRFNGGAQAAHHVVHEDVDHIFSHYGSGTLWGAKTFWGPHCLMDPVILMREYNLLKALGCKPQIAIHIDSPVVTPFDVEWNEYSEEWNNGTCGMGIYATVKRERELSLTFSDLYIARPFHLRLEMIRNYYRSQLGVDSLAEFIAACNWLRESLTSFYDCDASAPVISYDNLKEELYRNKSGVVFEGSQGLLLDQKHGFYPYVTPSNTGLDNLIEQELDGETWLVTRAYQTRHGKGPMSPIVDHKIKVNPYEQNTDYGNQGKFRRTLLDLDMLRYGLSRHRQLWLRSHILVVTCMDLLDGDYRVFHDGEVYDCKTEQHFFELLDTFVDADKIYVSRSPMGDLELVK